MRSALFMWPVTILLLGCVATTTASFNDELAQKISEASECIKKLVDCSMMYEPVVYHEVNGSFFDKPKDLERACQLNRNYLDCVDRTKMFCVRHNISPVEVAMIKNRLWLRELCAKNSKWKKVYAKHSLCIRKESLKSSKLCTKHIIDPLIPQMEFVCKFFKKFVDCNAKALKLECGEQASELYLRISFMKGNREYLCREEEPNQHAQEPFQMRVARQMLSNVQSLMKNISAVVRATMSEDDASYVLQELDPSEVERIRNLVRRTDGTEKDGFGQPPLFDLDLGEEEVDEFPRRDSLNEIDLEYLTDEAIKAKSDLKNGRSQLRSLLEEVNKNPEALYDADWPPQLQLVDASEDIDSDKVSPKVYGIDDCSCKRFEDILRRSRANLEFESNASLNVYAVQDHGQTTHLGSGQAMVHWQTLNDAPLDDLFCSWINPGASRTLFKCSIKLTELKPERQDLKTPVAQSVLLALYSSPASADHSKEVELSEVDTICMENFQPSEDISVEDVLPPLNSKLQDYMDVEDSHVKAKDEAEMELTDTPEESAENNCELDGSCFHSNEGSPDLFQRRSLELLQAENEVSDAFDKNLSFVLTEDCDFPEHVKDVENEFDSLLKQKLSDPLKKYQTSHCPTAVEVTGEVEDVVIENASSFAESDCPSAEEDIDLPDEIAGTDCKNGEIQNLVGTTLKPGVYVDVTSLATVTPFKFGKGCRFAENVNYIVVGDPYHPTESPLEATESIHVVPPSAEAIPISVGLLDAEQFIKNGIDSIQAEQMAESIQE